MVGMCSHAGAGGLALLAVAAPPFFLVYDAQKAMKKAGDEKVDKVIDTLFFFSFFFVNFETSRSTFLMSP